MQKKGTLWMADWRNGKGQRHRKGFTSKTAAQKHQDRMRGEIEATKKAHASRQSRPSPRRGRKPSHTGPRS